MKNAAHQPGSPTERDAADELGRIQEILFGAERRSIERAIETLGDALEARSARLESQWSERLDALENRIEGRLAKLSDELSSEREERQRLLAEERSEAGAAVDGLRAEHLAAVALLEGQVERLRHATTERKRLASALTELAHRLEEGPEDSGDREHLSGGGGSGPDERR